MKTKTTLILLGVAIILGIGILLLEKFVPSTEERDKKSARLVDINTGDITKIEIRKKDEFHLIATKEPDKDWQLIQPVKTKADQSVFDSVLWEFGYTDKIDEIKPEATEVLDLVSYGLVTPTITATFYTKDKTYQLKIGKKIPMGSGVYIQLGGDSTVFIVEPVLLEVFDKSLYDFREKKVFDFDLSQVRNIKLDKPDSVIELEKRDDNWYLVKPFAYKGLQSAVTMILRELLDLKAEAFISDEATDLEPYGLVIPQLKVGLTLYKDGQPQLERVLLIGAIDKDDPEKLYATCQGTNTVMVINQGSFDALNVTTNELRSNKLFELERGRLNAIMIKEGIRTIVAITKVNKAWRLVAPAEKLFASDEVKHFIYKLNDTVIEEFTDDDPADLSVYGLTKPAMEIAFTLTPVTETLLYQFGDYDAESDRCYVKRADEPFVYTVKNEIVDYFKKGHLVFRPKKIFDLTRDDIKRFTVEKIGRPSITCEQNEPKTWTVVTPSGTAEVNTDDLVQVNSILDNICQLEAIEFVAEEPFDLSNYGLDKPQVKVVFEVIQEETEEPKTYTLLVGEKRPDNSNYAYRLDQPVIFTVRPFVIELLQKDLRKPD